MRESFIASVIAPVIAFGAVSPSTGDEWPSFRGRDAAGIGAGSPLVEWDVPSGTGVLWRTEIPGLGHSSPVVWGDRMFVTTAIATAVAGSEAPLKTGLYGEGDPVEDEGSHQFKIYCLNRADGTITWERIAHEGVPRVKRHPKSSHANSTPATNGTHVVAFFASEGLHCFTVEGEHVWSRDFGVLNAGAPGAPTYEWGFASSPVIHGDMVIVQCDVQDQSFVAALDLATGQDIWRTNRDEDPTWSTPAVDIRDGRRQVICNGYKHIGGYDLATGAELWRMHGGGDVPVPTPVIAHDLIFITSAHGRQAPVYAIHPMVSGDVSADPAAGHMAWSIEKNGNYMQTPLVYGDELYCCRDNGVLSCFDARTGTLHYRDRLDSGGSGFSASIVAADGRLYCTGEEGEVHVVKAGTALEVLAVNKMGEQCMATPALIDGTLYFRSRHHVIAIGATAVESPGQN
jgi:outer membrane protein assembly factor BamB